MGVQFFPEFGGYGFPVDLGVSPMFRGVQEILCYASLNTLLLRCLNNSMTFCHLFFAFSIHTHYSSTYAVSVSKRIFSYTKEKKVMENYPPKIHFLEVANLRIIWLKSSEFQRYSIGWCLTIINITFLTGDHTLHLGHLLIFRKLF